MLMMSRMKNLNRHGDVILRNEAIQSNQGKNFKRNCWLTHKLERPHINGATQNF